MKIIAATHAPDNIGWIELDDGQKLKVKWLVFALPIYGKEIAIQGTDIYEGEQILAEVLQ